GMRAGEEKKVELTFPEDTSEGELAGKTGTFSIRPSQVAEKVLPALDDGFAKTVGVADIETLRRTVRNELAHAAFHEARDAAADKLTGLDSPDAEREAIRKAGGEDFDPHAAPEPKAEESKIIVPTKTDATPEGREALRAMLEKK